MAGQEFWYDQTRIHLTLLAKNFNFVRNMRQGCRLNNIVEYSVPSSNTDLIKTAPTGFVENLNCEIAAMTSPKSDFKEQCQYEDFWSAGEELCVIFFGHEQPLCAKEPIAAEQ